MIPASLKMGLIGAALAISAEYILRDLLSTFRFNENLHEVGCDLIWHGIKPIHNKYECITEAYTLDNYTIDIIDNTPLQDCEEYYLSNRTLCYVYTPDEARVAFWEPRQYSVDTYFTILYVWIFAPIFLSPS